MLKKIRVGTRGSPLALWQASYVASILKAKDIVSRIVKIKSEGERDRVTPLYQMGITGIFTKALDAALLEERIDIAVHSLKDVPTTLAEGLEIAAIPPRGNPFDLLVYKDAMPDDAHPFLLATGSIRRKYQWLNRFSRHTVQPIRGNINTRIEKFKDSAEINGMVLAAAAVERLHIGSLNSAFLRWMLPAPGQGALAIVARKGEKPVNKIIKNCDDLKTRKAVETERSFLRALGGGCSAPIACHVKISDEKLFFTGGVYSSDATETVTVARQFSVREPDPGIRAAKELIKNGGGAVIQSFKS